MKIFYLQDGKEIEINAVLEKPSVAVENPGAPNQRVWLEKLDDIWSTHGYSKSGKKAVSQVALRVEIDAAESAR